MDYCNDCNFTFNGIALDCNSNVGGILAVWMAPCSEITTITVTDDVVTALEAPVWKKYDVNPFSSSFDVDITIDETIGSELYDTTINLLFRHMDVEKNTEIQNLAKQGVVMVVKDANKEYWFFGDEVAVKLQTSSATTGIAREDGNGYTLAFLNRGTHMPLGLSSTLAPDAPPAP